MQNLAKWIDHTLLKPGATSAQFSHLCSEAREHQFATVCVPLTFVAQCVQELKGSNVKTITVVGFPTGNVPTAEKVNETKEGIRNGASEIDMVIQVELLKKRELAAVYKDIEQVVLAAGSAPVKVIIETCLLSHEEKIIACSIAKSAGAKFVKTSTGFSTGGATSEDIALMRSVVGKDMGVKASGGIRNRQDAEKMITAGATRLGTSNGVAIVAGENAGNSGY